jgi:hypothetical protein
MPGEGIALMFAIEIITLSVHFNMRRKKMEIMKKRSASSVIRNPSLHADFSKLKLLNVLVLLRGFSTDIKKEMANVVTFSFGISFGRY